MADNTINIPISIAVIIADLLDIAADKFENHGCNDFTLPNTPENRGIVSRVMRWADSGDDREPLIGKNGKIWTQDDLLMRYMVEYLRKGSDGNA